MKKLIFCLTIIYLTILCNGVSFAEEEKETPLGMEYIKVGSAQILVPQGSRVTRTQSGMVYPENTEQYMARRFLELEEKIEKIEKKEEELESAINELNTDARFKALDQKIDQIRAEEIKVKEVPFTPQTAEE